MHKNRRRNYLRLLILATLVVNLELSLLLTGSYRRVEIASIDELVYPHVGSVSQLVYYLVFDNYRATTLVISREAQELLEFDAHWSSGPRVISKVTVVEGNAVADGLPAPTEAARIQEYEVAEQRSLRFVLTDENAAVDTVYAIRIGDTVLFIPDELESD